MANTRIFPNIFYIISYEFNEEYDFLYNFKLDANIVADYFKINGDIYFYKDTYQLEFYGNTAKDYTIDHIDYFVLKDWFDNVL